MISVNKRAAVIVRQMIDDAEALGLNVHRLANGTTVVDAGVNVPGSLEAGRLFSCACLGGLGQVSFTQQVFHLGADNHCYFNVPSVAVTVSHPAIACMGSQYAGWAIKLGRYFAIGSGPARALFADEDIYKKLGYQDQCEAAILMLETRELPDVAVASHVAEKCRVRPEQLTLLVAPTASIVGSVQVAARSAETGLHKLVELNFNVAAVAHAIGLCPLAPVACDDLHAIGRTNDAILYGSQVFYSVRTDDDVLTEMIEKIPSASSRDYGKLFYDLFMQYNGDFYQIDRLLFSPAEVEISNLNSGRLFRSGHLNASLIQASFLEN
jgi:methenyltetrahydromethanopterin cyclohydrolase